MKEKKEFQKAEIEVIHFEKQTDIITTSTSGFTEITGSGANPANTPDPPPPLF